MTLHERLRQRMTNIHPVPLNVSGRLTRMVGLTLEAVGLSMVTGGRCFIDRDQGSPVEAEVVGFSGATTFLMPVASIEGLRPGARVRPAEGIARFPAGMSLLGRVLDGRGQPLDGRGELHAEATVGLLGPVINPLSRQPIRSELDVGVRTINALFTVGRGQRMGLFAGSGVGKSVLLGMMARHTQADITVVGLIGERGREVKEFIDDILGEEGLRRAVVVASPADDPPLLRLHAAALATALAEYYRDQGLHVLLLMDSLTRFAQAQREIALAIGEPPATKGYPPSVFAKLPFLVERAGNGRDGQGSMTAFYTVLTEGDDLQDPVADAARAILDGHLVLSRSLADEGHFPAIDVEGSISRLMQTLSTPDQLRRSLRFKQMWSRYRQNRDLISIGAYVRGSDPDTDFAVEHMTDIHQFLRQGMLDAAPLQMSRDHLFRLVSQLPGGG
ncbi:MAG: flagellar protein export ATPase FliI [Pseudomonadales bacterium]|nr:flagellar protein export ATPase FliI [Pseudomonadales bacterium]